MSGYENFSYTKKFPQNCWDKITIFFEYAILSMKIHPKNEDIFGFMLFC